MQYAKTASRTELRILASWLDGNKTQDPLAMNGYRRNRPANSNIAKKIVRGVRVRRNERERQD